jgi:TolA-binding protein
MKRIKKINEEHRAGINELKSQIRDFKAVKMTLTSTEISLAKMRNDQKSVIDKLNNDIRRIKQEKVKLSGLVTSLTNEKEIAVRKLDESVALKLKGQQICAKLALEKKEKVALIQRTIQAKSNGTKTLQTALQHKQEMCVFNAELKVKSHKRTLEIKEEI